MHDYRNLSFSISDSVGRLVVTRVLDDIKAI